MAYCSPVLLHRRPCLFLALPHSLRDLSSHQGWNLQLLQGALSSYRRTAQGVPRPTLTLTLTPDPNRWVWWPPIPTPVQFFAEAGAPEGRCVLGLALAGGRVPVRGPAAPVATVARRLLLLLAGRVRGISEGQGAH